MHSGWVVAVTCYCLPASLLRLTERSDTPIKGYLAIELGLSCFCCARAVGFSGCLGKPFTVDGLRRVLLTTDPKGWLSITAD